MIVSKGRFILNLFSHIIGTTTHKLRVFIYLFIFCIKLLYRGLVHDLSKYSWYESKHYAEIIHLLRGSTYGSVIYRESLRHIKPAIKHHYKRSKHHPEHWENEINDMSLLDFVEMAYDWKAASKRHKNGDTNKSIDVNKKRFNMDETAVTLLKNTIGDKK